MLMVYKEETFEMRNLEGKGGGGKCLQLLLYD